MPSASLTFQRGSTALVVAVGDLRAAHGDLTPEAVRFYRELFGTARVRLDLGFGLNVSPADFKSGRIFTVLWGAVRKAPCGLPFPEPLWWLQ